MIQFECTEIIKSHLYLGPGSPSRQTDRRCTRARRTDLSCLLFLPRLESGRFKLDRPANGKDGEGIKGSETSGGETISGQSF